MSSRPREPRSTVLWANQKCDAVTCDLRGARERSLANRDDCRRVVNQTAIVPRIVGRSRPSEVSATAQHKDGLLHWDLFPRAYLSRSTSLFGRTMSCCRSEEESVPGKINEDHGYRAETNQNSRNKRAGSSYWPLHFTACRFEK